MITINTNGFNHSIPEHTDIEQIVDEHLKKTWVFEVYFDNFLKERYDITVEEFQEIIKNALPEKYI